MNLFSSKLSTPVSALLLAASGILATGFVACSPRRGPDTPTPAAGPRASTFEAGAASRIRDSVRTVLERAIADSAFPGGYAVIGTADGIVAEWGAGVLDPADPVRPSATTVWDLASLTKVVGTTSAMLQLIGSGKVALDAPVVRYLPAWQARGTSSVTIRHLLTHSAGLPAWRALYKEARDPEEARRQVLATGPDTVPGTRLLYSDLGFILLGMVVERVSGEPLDQYTARHVFAPLGMTDTRFLPPAAWVPRIAPTERDPWRQRHLRGEVHDENASRLGGVSGHAGLFSTARDLSRLARAYLQHGQLAGVRVFDSTTVGTFTSVQDSTVSRRALGWETPTGGNSAGRRLSSRAFGHTGFTGTSLWMDPQRGLFVILLTNRVNPTRENRKIGAVRSALADAVVGAMDGGAPLGR
ncbi:MAG: hypothetical protein RLZZ621_1625 [Gemmatimonadota bacterium]